MNVLIEEQNKCPKHNTVHVHTNIYRAKISRVAELCASKNRGGHSSGGALEYFHHHHDHLLLLYTAAHKRITQNSTCIDVHFGCVTLITILL